MALTKRTYVDGETIITAQNLNDIQDEIISLGNNTVPKTRTVNGKALSGNVTLNAGDIPFSGSAAYSADTVGKSVKDLIGRIDNLYVNGTGAFYSVSDLATYLSGRATGDIVLARIASTAAAAFFESGTAKPTLCIMLKGGSTNAYFLATTQDDISIGNLNVSTGSITILKDLAFESDLSNLSDDVDDLSDVVGSLSTRTVTHTYSANAGANANANLKTIIDADLPSGYTFLAIAGYGSGNANVVVYSARYANNNYSLGLKNVGTSAVSDAEASISYLCIAR